jgi:NAD-dependent deacetylase
VSGVQADLIAQVRGWIDAAQRVVVLTGAGISTDSGIPDFRGPNGVWTRNPGAERRATLQNYMSDPAVRREAWRTRMDHPGLSARPNPGLHQAARSDPAKVVEVHGTMHDVMCMSCGERAPMEKALARVRAGEDDPPCRSCGGILKSATISFGQNLVPEDLQRAVDAARRCDLLLAVGSTLAVYPVADMVPVARMAGARIVIVNAEETAMDDLADAVIRGSISEVLPALVGSGEPELDASRS